MTCTFFGHRKCPKEVVLPLKSTLEDLIEKQNVDMFYVGNQGNFDSTVRKILRQLKPIYPHIDYAVVFAYMPCRKNTVDGADFSDTIFPCELENTPPKYAIYKRNMWMLNRADYVVTYVRCITGGAAQFKGVAEKKGKKIINL